jgi:ribosome biogenesis protein Nip4
MWKMYKLFHHFFHSKTRWKIWNKIYNFSCKNNTSNSYSFMAEHDGEKLKTFFTTFLTRKTNVKWVKIVQWKGCKINDCFHLFFTHFSVEKNVENVKPFHRFFHSKTRWKIWNKMYSFLCKNNINNSRTFMAQNDGEKLKTFFITFLTWKMTSKGVKIVQWKKWKMSECFSAFSTCFALKTNVENVKLFHHFFHLKTRWKIWNKIYNFSCKSNTYNSYPFTPENDGEKCKTFFTSFLARKRIAKLVKTRQWKIV